MSTRADRLLIGIVDELSELPRLLTDMAPELFGAEHVELRQETTISHAVLERAHEAFPLITRGER